MQGSIKPLITLEIKMDVIARLKKGEETADVAQKFNTTDTPV